MTFNVSPVGRVLAHACVCVCL